MSRMPCSITDGPASTMDADIESQEPQEPEYDKYLHSSDNMKIDTLAAKLLEKKLLRMSRSKK